MPGSKITSKAAANNKNVPSKHELDVPFRASIRNLWIVTSKLPEDSIRELWADSFSCSRDDLDAENNTIRINAARGSSPGVFDGETRLRGWIPGHYYNGARLTLHQSVFYESYLLAGWSDENSEKEASCFSGLVLLASYYRQVFLDLVLTTTKQFGEGPCPESWRWPRFDNHLIREYHVGIHDPKDPKVKEFKYDKPDPVHYDWARWAENDDTKRAMFHSPHFDCFRGLSWHGLTIGERDLRKEGFASSIEFKSLCKLAQKGDPAPDDVDEILSEALNGENSIHEEDSTPEVLISESTTGLVDSLNAAMEMSVEERESNDDGSEVDEKHEKRGKKRKQAKVERTTSLAEKSATRKIRKLGEKGLQDFTEVPSGSSQSRMVIQEYIGERNGLDINHGKCPADLEGELNGYYEPPVIESETIYEGSNLFLCWTDLYPNQHEISSGRYHRFIFGYPVRIPQAAHTFLVIPRHDVLTGNVCLALIAPPHYHDHLVELLAEITRTVVAWLKALASSTDSEVEQHGLGTWLRYLDDCREKIFNEIREKVNQQDPDYSSLDDVRLPILEEWTIKHQQSLHAVPSDRLDHALFHPDNIPAVVAEVNRRTLDCRPGTNESYLLKPPKIAADDVLDASQGGLGGSYWKRETIESIVFQHSQCNSLRGEKDWIPIQALRLENPMSTISHSILQIETVRPVSVPDPTVPGGCKVDFVPVSHSVAVQKSFEKPTSMPTQDPEEQCRSMSPENLADVESFIDFSYAALEEDDMASQSNITGPDNHGDSSHSSSGQHLSGSVDLDIPQNDTNDTDDHGHQVCFSTTPLFSDDDGSVDFPAVSRSDGVPSALKRSRGRPHGSKSKKDFSSWIPSTRRTLRSSHQDDHLQATTSKIDDNSMYSVEDSSIYSVEEVILRAPSKPKIPSHQSPQDDGESDSVSEQGGVLKTSEGRATFMNKGKVSEKSTASLFNLVANGEFVTEADVKFLETLPATIKSTRDLIANLDTYSEGAAQLHEIAKAIRRMKLGPGSANLKAKLANLSSSRDDAKSFTNVLKEIPHRISQYNKSQNKVVQTITKDAIKHAVHLLEDFCALGWDIHHQSDSTSKNYKL